MSKHTEPTRWLDALDGAPPHLRELLESQLGAADLGPGPDDAARLSRVLGRLSGQVGRPELATAFEAHAADAGTTAAGVTTVASAIKLGIAMLVVGTLAFGATLALRPSGPSRTRSEPPPPSAAQPAAPAAETALPASAAANPELAAASSESAELPPPAKAPPRTGSGRERAADPAAELALLEQAQHTLHDAPERTLALAAEHKRRFARGQFAQEREMLAIEALLLVGRDREARQRGRVFVRSFPDSSHMPRLTQLLQRNAQ